MIENERRNVRKGGNIACFGFSRQNGCVLHLNTVSDLGWCVGAEAKKRAKCYAVTNRRIKFIPFKFYTLLGI